MLSSLSQVTTAIAYFISMHASLNLSNLISTTHFNFVAMDGVLALAAERGLLNNFSDGEWKKKNKDEQSETRSEAKKQKMNDGGSNETKRNKEKEKVITETVTVVMKVDFHCDGCRRRIFDAARSFRGTETVKIEEEKNKLTVVGKVDPVKLHEMLERRTKKKIDLVSPQPKKKDKNKNDDGHNNDKKEVTIPITTVVLKMSLHCDGCYKRIRQIVRKTEGVHSVEIDREKELVTVRGAVDPKGVQMRLKMKMKRSVEILPAKKDKEKGNGEKMEGNNGGGNQKQQKCQKMCGCGGGGNGNGNNGGRGPEAMDALMDYYGPIYGYVPAAGYVVERLHAPQIFSDENPNACSVM